MHADTSLASFPLAWGKKGLTNVLGLGFYCYVIYDGTIPVYVGKGRHGRVLAHVHKTGPALSRLRDARLSEGRPLTVCVVRQFGEDEDAAFGHERYLINLYGRAADGGTLLNAVNGGAGASGRFVNLAGLRFGKLTAETRDEERPSYWRCHCDCGAAVSVYVTSLRKGATKSCGCLSRELTHVREPIDLAGEQFGRLTVLNRDGSEPGGARWRCRCECGTEKTVRSAHLRFGRTKSCGAAGCQKLVKKKRGALKWTTATPTL